MIKDVLNIAKSLIILADDIRQYRSDLKEIRRELRDLTLIVHALAHDFKHSKQQGEREKENLLLELENKLLLWEKRLPGETGQNCARIFKPQKEEARSPQMTSFLFPIEV